MQADHDPSRRLLLGSLALGLTIVAPAAAGAEAPSDLALACDWATAHWIRLNDPLREDGWDDDRRNSEVDRYGVVFQRAISEPSRSRADVAAKARLVLEDFESSLFPYRDAAKNAELEPGLDDCQRLLRVVLREIATIGA